MARRATKKEKTTMLRLTKHYSEGIQSSSGRTSRNLSGDSVSGVRIIYIISLFTITIRNQYRQCIQYKLYCQNSQVCGILGDIVGALSLFALLIFALIFGGVLL